MEEQKQEIKKSAYDPKEQVAEYIKNSVELRNANITPSSPIVKQLMYLMVKHRLNPIAKEVYIVPFGNDPQLIISYTKIMEIGAKAIPNYGGYLIIPGPEHEFTISSYNGDVNKRLLPRWLDVKIKQSSPHHPEEKIISTTRVYWEEVRGTSPIWRSKPYYMYEKTALANAFRKIPSIDLGGAIIESEFDNMKANQPKIAKPQSVEVEVEINGIESQE